MSDGTANGEKNITKYFYSNGGIQTKMETGLNSANDSDYMTTNYAYDAWGHLVNTTDSTGYNSGTTTYDLNGNVLTVTDANGNVTTNTYDALNRVLTANTVCSDTSKNVSKSYVYDNMVKLPMVYRQVISTISLDVFIRNLAQNLLRAISTRVYLSMRRSSWLVLIIRQFIPPRNMNTMLKCVLLR